MHSPTRPALLALVAGLVFAPGAHAAGNVIANVYRESLMLMGDVDGNLIDVTQGGTPDEMVVTGVAGTTVNGLADATLTGITRNVIAFMDAGNDTLQFTNVDVPLNLDVEASTEDDIITVMGGHVGRNISIGTGMGLDDVTITGTIVVGHTSISTDFDADVITVTGVTLNRRLKLSSGHGADSINVNGASVLLDNLILKNIDGDDIVALDTVDLEGNMKVSMGNDPDVLTFKDVAASQRVIISGGDGTDIFDDLGGNAFATAPILKSIEIVQ